MAYRTRKVYSGSRPDDIDGEIWAWFTGEVETMPDEGYLARDLPGQFRRNEAGIVAAWLAKNPAGTRPPCWWKWCAPEPRRQISGRGIRVSDRYPAVVPRYESGIPCDFVEVDEADPPQFESERECLGRLGLLTADE